MVNSSVSARANGMTASPASPHVDSTDQQGLSQEEAARRLIAEGPNQLPKPNKRNFVRILLDVLREPMFSLLIGGGVIYWLLGDTPKPCYC